MKKSFKLGVIGGGFMAHAIIRGAILSGAVKEKKIILSSLHEEDFEKFADFKITTTLSNRVAAENCEYLLLAVKPQNFPDLAEDLKGVSVEKVISIMAAITRAKIKGALGGKSKVCRVMPNLPCSIGSGMVAGDVSDFDADGAEFVKTLFSGIGEFMPIKEDKIDAVTGISGSGPAYVYLFIQSLVEAGVKNGLTQEQAITLAVQTVIGGAEMVKRTEDKTIPELISSVCSKGGTTIQAMNVFEKEDFKGTVCRAVDACVARAKELSK